MVISATTCVLGYGTKAKLLSKVKECGAFKEQCVCFTVSENEVFKNTTPTVA